MCSLDKKETRVHYQILLFPAPNFPRSSAIAQHGLSRPPHLALFIPSGRSLKALDSGCSRQSSRSFSKRWDSLKCTRRLSELGFQKLCYLIPFHGASLKKKKGIYLTQCPLITLFQQNNHAGLLEGFIKCSLLYFLPFGVLLFSENSCV